MKKLLLIFVLSLMAIFAGCADDKDNNTDTETDIPENITYSFLVDSLSFIDKTDNTSEWRFLPYDDTDPLEAVFADMLGRPDNETDKIMCVSVLGVYEGEKESGPCYGRPCGYYDSTTFRAYVYEKKHPIIVMILVVLFMKYILIIIYLHISTIIKYFLVISKNKF